ncbi:hypothetical protein INS49_015903 [Diaporthe citri]|uniref:uncharacterized protein n=1 Tax=Diaporthe citri TaxID=83186 RepID=UPI001C7FE392|nr:uncharacterized protein INS49_015903 [Diaporthe citri]KAG6356515.1 hypothetical protein INS49_015903 [Diaporthe citri]
MSVPRLLFITVALLAADAISQEDQGGTCGPFALTTTSGTLYSAPNGTQLPGSTQTELEPGQYLISDNGTLTTHNGSLCEFRPYLICLPNNTHSEGDGAFVVGEYGRLSYSNNDTFNGCSPSVEDGSTFEDMRIFPGSAPPGNGSGVASCGFLAMQASRCHPGENDAESNNTDAAASSSNSTNATGETNGANSTEDGPTTSGTSGLMMGLSTSLYGLFLVLGLASS